MKLFKTLLATAALALSLAGAASAQTTVHIIGSTAFRGQVHNAISHVLQAGYSYAYYTDPATGFSDFGHATRVVFSGTTSASSPVGSAIPVVIKVAWTGSVGGVQSVVQNLTPTSAGVQWWLSETGNTLTTAGNSLSSPVYNETTTTPDACMSDSFQSSTAYTSPLLTDHVIGVVPFLWVKDRDASSTTALSNITPLLARALLQSGLPLSQFTGSASDHSIFLYAMGRDEDSGTRLDAFAEPGFGVFSFPNQYQPTITGTAGPNGSITNAQLWPATTVNGVNYGIGHSGFANGPDLAAALNTPGSRTNLGVDFIGYLSVGDAQNVGNSTGNWSNALSYNGVNYVSTSTTTYGHDALVNGLYTFWSYEHVMHRASLTSGNTYNTVIGIAKQLFNSDSQSTSTLGTTTIYKALKLSDMNVGRTTEGGTVTDGNPYTSFQ